jgi:antirestriction protein
MTDIRNTADVLDVRDIISRFEELEGERKAWAVGWNMPGYMPDAEPSHHAEWSDARDSLIETLRLNCDEAFDLADDISTAKARCAVYDAAIEALDALDEGAEFGSTIGNYHYWISKLDERDAFDDTDDAQEYATLKELLDDLRGNGGDEQWRGDWYPVTLIRDSHFTDAMQELCEDIGDFPNGVPDYYVIDWEATARNLRVDYSSTEFDGVTFWYR